MPVPCYTTHGRSHSLGILLREKENGKYRDNKFQRLPAGPFICTWRQDVYWDKVDLWWSIINSLWYVLDDGYLPPRHLATAALSPRENNHIKPEQKTPQEWRTKKKKKKLGTSLLVPSVLFGITEILSPTLPPRQHHESPALVSQHFLLQVFSGTENILAICWTSLSSRLLYNSLATNITPVMPMLSV